MVRTAYNGVWSEKERLCLQLCGNVCKYAPISVTKASFYNNHTHTHTHKNTHTLTDYLINMTTQTLTYTYTHLSTCTLTLVYTHAKTLKNHWEETKPRGCENMYNTHRSKQLLSVPEW